MPYQSPDGVKRNDKVEYQLNEAFAITFNSPAGKLVLDYLKSVTMHNIMGPGHNTDVLQHLEGQRWLTGLILQRAELGEQKLPAVEQGND